MTEINVIVRGASAVARLSGALTEKAVGIKAEFVFDEAWDNLSKVIVFRSGDKATNGIEIDGIATVPWELLNAGEILSVGIVGRSQDGKVVIPTVWADCGMVKPSAAGVEPGDPEPEPSPDVVEQINQKADEAYRKAEEAIEKVENFAPGGGSGEGEPGKDGGFYTPNVDEDGNLTWTASDPNMPEVPGSNIQGPRGGKGDDYVLTEADKQEIAEQAAELVKIPEGFSGSWNDLTDKPFDVGEPVYTTLYSATKEITEAEVGNQTYIEVDVGYRRSDRITATHPNCKIVCKIGDEVFERVMWNGIGKAVNKVGILGYHNGKQVGYDGPMRLNNKTGIYLARIYFTPSKPCTVTAEYQYFTGYTAEDDAWVPHSIARVDDIPDAVVNPSTAEVGQTIVVKAVDENGKPTEWDSADRVASVNGKTGEVTLTAEDVGAEAKLSKIELIEEITLTEDVHAIERMQEPSGRPYDFISVAVAGVFLTDSNVVNVFVADDVGIPAWEGAAIASLLKMADVTYYAVSCIGIAGVRFSQAGTSSGDSTVLYPTLQTAFHTEKLLKTGNVKKILIVVGGDAKILAGSVFKIYGVRANEN